MKKIVTYAALLLPLVAAIGPAHARSDYDATAAERKADWLFMQGVERNVADDDAGHYALMSRALELTPDKSDRESYEVGSRKLMMAFALRDSLMAADALGLVDRYVRAHPSDIYAGSMLARAYAGTGNKGRALDIYDVMERVSPNKPDLIAAHAELLLADSLYDKAIELYRRLETTMGKNARLAQRISNIRLWQGDTLGAIKEVNDYIKENPKDVEALMLAASAAVEFKQPGAADYVARAIAADPADEEVYAAASKLYQDLGLSEDYARMVRAAVDGDDLGSAAKVRLVQAYMPQAVDSVTGRPTADHLVASLLRQYPGDYDVRMLVMAANYLKGRYDDVITNLEAAIDINHDDPDDYIMLSRVYFTQDQPDKAAATLRRGLEHHPRHIELWELLAGIYGQQKEYRLADESLQKALLTDSLGIEAQASLWRARGDNAQHDPSAGNPDEFYGKALELTPNDDLLLNNYAYYLAQHGGDLLKAKELIAKAVIYNPGSPTYYDTYAWVLYRLGNLEEAKRYIDLALTSDRTVDDVDRAAMTSELLYHAGEIYKALGQKDKAMDYLQKVVDYGDKADAEVLEAAKKTLSTMK